MTLDTATEDYVSAALASRTAATHELTPAEARARGAALIKLIGPGPAMETVRAERIARVDGSDLPVRVLVPNGALRGVIGYFHGGGWVLGSLDEFDCLARTIAARTGCVVVMVDYRLAPEDPYPAAVNDTSTAVKWLKLNVRDLAGDDLPLALLGDSAGGNLAIGAALEDARSVGPHIDALVLAYPVTDCDFTRPSYLHPDNQLLMGVETMQWFFRHYAADASVWSQPDVSVVRAQDLSGLPKTLVLLGEHDPLRDEGQEFSDRLRAAGVSVETKVFQGQMHGFLGLINILPGAYAALEAIVNFLEPVLAAAAADRPIPSSDLTAAPSASLE